MKEKVAQFLEKDEEKILWEELYSIFQECGKDKVKEIIINKINSIKEEFKNYKEIIRKDLGGS
ncbi:MAG: hypothetical protein QW103_02810 [Candidatus Pacearchaeota archaeon]